jgi:hypothetical protein
MVGGRDAGVQLIGELAVPGQFDRSHRVGTVRAHLLEQKGDVKGAETE